MNITLKRCLLICYMDPELNQMLHVDPIDPDPDPRGPLKENP